MKRPDPQVTASWVGKGPLDEVCISIVDDCIMHHTKPNGTILAHLVQRLIKAESVPGGPYYNADKIIDPFTNLAVGYLFSYLHTPLPNVTRFIETTRLQSPSAFRTPTAKLLLKKYDELQSPPIPKLSSSRSTATYQQAKTRLNLLEEPLKTSALTFLSRIKQADKTQEIALLPAFFYNSLVLPTISSPPLAQLGQANIYCWIAYTIYDHLLDGEPIVELLPVASTTQRLAIASYESLFPQNHPFMQKLQATFTAMDTANAWEMKYARLKREGETITIAKLPSYNQRGLLARRSFGHALGPLALSYLSGYSQSQIRHIEKGFHHYLIARQLSDDLLDWQEDLQLGQCSVVVTSLLKKAQLPPGPYNVDILIPRLQPSFWNHTTPTINSLIHRHIHKAEEAFMKSGVIKKDSELLALLARVDKTATQSLWKHQQAKDFLATYKRLS